VYWLLRHRRLDRLITCIVLREGEGWGITWAADGKTPSDSDETSLSAAVERASSAVAAMYAGKPEQADGELQFAIYPWQGGADKVMLDISQDGTELTARDIQGTGITFQSHSIDALVADAERYLPNPNDAMIRWIRPIAKLNSR